MSNEDKLKNVLSFLCILFGEKIDVMNYIFDLSPEYIIEKYERYVLSDATQWPWGMHPSLKKSVFDKYLMKYKIEKSEY